AGRPARDHPRGPARELGPGRRPRTRQDGRMSLDALSPDRTALLVVDMQNAFCHPKGTLGISGVDVGPAQATIEPVRRLVEAAQEARVPVLWTQQEHFA